MMHLFESSSIMCSQIVTKTYSTSFTLGIQTLHKRFQDPVYAIYGFVRYADEIVDTFHEYDKAYLLKRFREDTLEAITEKISLNPILHSFQRVVNSYQIDLLIVEDFLYSMQMDLHKQQYDLDEYQKYIYGSAEVVGLMCLKVFCEGDEECYEQLKQPARSLGAAFQKVNFLRDMQSDFTERGRTYFPHVNMDVFTPAVKQQIEQNIQQDFQDAYRGILQLPKGAQQGVYLAYLYYLNLFKKIRNCTPARLTQERIRVPNHKKLLLLMQTYVKYSLQSA